MALARSVASSSAPRDPRPDRDSDRISAANDSLISRPSRVSTRTLDDIDRRLGDHDREVLHVVARLRIASGAQLARALWEEEPGSDRQRRARRALKRLTDWRVLDRLPRTVGGVRAGSSGFLYCVGPVGSRLLARYQTTPRRLHAPGDRYVAHTLAVAELVVGLHEAQRAGRLDVLGIETEPACWRPFTAGLGARLVLKPDLFVRVGVGSYEDRWMVEVDMATESPATITRKARTYLAHYRSGSEQTRHGVYPRVLWTVPDERRAEVVRDALAVLPVGADRLFAVCTHDDTLDRLAEEASS